MTFYQELQLNQAGSKHTIRQSESWKEKLHHTGIYLLKIALTMAFCFSFVAVYSVLFGGENSIVGVVVLLCLLVFRQADFGVGLKDSTVLFLLFFGIMMVGPHAANLVGPLAGAGINFIFLLILMLLGCHDPRMSNHSTLVLGYLLLYGYDVSGESLKLRCLGLALGCALTILVFWKTHRGRAYQQRIKDIFEDFHFSSPIGRWQLGLVLCVSLAICISELCQMPRAMWAGIAAMSVMAPQLSQAKNRSVSRVIGNICGGICFLLLYQLLPSSIYAYIGILGGIGVGLSAKYGWQAVFNTFGALAVAAEAFGFLPSVHLRVLQNVFGSVFALLFCLLLAGLAHRGADIKAAEIEQNRNEEGA